MRPLLFLLAVLYAFDVRAGGTWDFRSAEFFTPTRAASPSDSFDDLIDGRAPQAERVNIALAAYLQLTGWMSPAHRALLATRPEPPQASADFGSVLAEAGFHAPHIERYKWRDGVHEGQRTSFSYLNCLPDAFDTAARTFQQREARYGVGSPALARWVRAQLQVFAHCSDNDYDPPAPASEDWPRLERQDRAYQIAAANFYAERYEIAARDFEAIAADTTSPWRDVAAYLVARAFLRRATVDGSNEARDLAIAARHADALRRDTLYRERFPAIDDLHRRITFQQNPGRALDQLSEQFVYASDEMSTRAFHDLRFTLTHSTPTLGLSAWVHEATHGPLRRRYAAPRARPHNLAWQHYQQAPSLPWLVLAMAEASVDDPRDRLERLLRAAREAPARSPGIDFTVQRLEARLLGALGRAPEACALAERLQGNSGISAASQNRLRRVLAENASSWGDFFQYAAMPATSLNIETEPHPRRPHVDAETRLLPPEFARIVNAHLSAEGLLEISMAGRAGDYLQERLQLAAWTRAIVTDDAQTAERAAVLIAQAVPWLAPSMRAYLAAENKGFEAARILAKTPGLSPFIRPDAGRVDPSGVIVRDDIASGFRSLNWWCPLNGEDAIAKPAGLAGTLRPRDRARLAMPPVMHFGPAVVSYAEAALDDPRVPEVLHRVVFATRHACAGGPGETSKQAFELLHARYGDSPWARKTPYWYD